MYHIFAGECGPFNLRFNKPRHENLAIISLTNTCITFVHAKRFSTPCSARCPSCERAVSLKIEKLEKNQVQSQAQAVLGGQQVQRNLDESDWIAVCCIHTAEARTTNSVSLELRGIPVLSVFMSPSRACLQATREKVDEYSVGRRGC